MAPMDYLVVMGALLYLVLLIAFWGLVIIGTPLLLFYTVAWVVGKLRGTL